MNDAQDAVNGVGTVGLLDRSPPGLRIPSGLESCRAAATIRLFPFADAVHRRRGQIPEGSHRSMSNSNCESAELRRQTGIAIFCITR